MPEPESSLELVPQFVALDLETTGLDPRSDRIIEIAAVRLRAGVEVAAFSELADPGRDLPPVVTGLTGIRDSDLRGRPAVDDLLPRVVEFIADSPLVLHNASFDLSFLRNALSRYNRSHGPARLALPARLKAFDTLQLARVLLPGLRGYSLESLAREFGSPAEPAHRALSDCRAAASVFRSLLDRIMDLPESRLRRLIHGLPGESGHLKRLLRDSLRLRPHRPAAVALLPDNSLEWKGPTPERGDLPDDFSRQYLGADGPLPRLLHGFRERPGQLRMSEIVCESLNRGGVALVEAGTGIGKSLAYLIPALRWAAANSGRVIVSTHTRHLQDQLFFKDLPTAAAALQVPHRSVLLKGRGNYLCLKLWREAVQQPRLLGRDTARHLMPVFGWLEVTRSGDIEENPALSRDGFGRLWRSLSADNPACAGALCPFYRDCFLYRARRKAAGATLVVANHALVLTDLIREGSVLGDYRHVVFDEAHHLEAAAIDALTRAITLGRLRRLMDSVERAAAGRLRPFTAEVETAARYFFENLALSLNKRLGNNPYPKLRYTRAEPLGDLPTAWGPVAESLAGLLGALENLKNGIAAGAGADEEAAAIGNLMDETRAVLSDGAFLAAAESGDHVFWAEADRAVETGRITLLGAPLRVDGELRGLIFERMRTAILTSATLSDGRSFDYLKSRLGLDRAGAAEIRPAFIPSPFDYPRQLKAAVVLDLPDPKDRQQYADALPRFLADLLRDSPRRTMILFTSHQLLGQVAGNLRQILGSQDRTMLIQGIDGSRQALLSRFRSAPGAVLLGTDSFWEGIDLPGDLLEQLIITRIPFPVPSEPWNEATMERLQAAGQDSFHGFMLPRAVLKLRQGLGRLIRSDADKGLLVVTDRRLSTTGYGALLRAALPVPLASVGTRRELAALCRKWWSTKELI